MTATDLFGRSSEVYIDAAEMRSCSAIRVDEAVVSALCATARRGSNRTGTPEGLELVQRTTHADAGEGINAFPAGVHAADCKHALARIFERTPVRITLPAEQQQRPGGHAEAPAVGNPVRPSSISIIHPAHTARRKSSTNHSRPRATTLRRVFRLQRLVLIEHRRRGERGCS